jgi:uncharacterized membrane protein YgaE (UPF0421/DUF939 family)
MKTRIPQSQPASKRAVESTTRSLEALRGRWAPRERFRSDAIPLLQAALAAGLAWFVARDLVGHTAPIFAPIGALLILSNAPGRRTSRVLAATLGAIIGIAVGDLLVSAIGTGAIQVAVVALLAMSATAVLGASPAVVTNAGIAAVLIATVQPAHGFYSPAAARRLVDVLIGGATSLAVLVLLPAHSLSSTRRAATALLVELSATLDEVASALERRDGEAAERALEHARGLDSFVGRLREESDLAHEAVLLAPVDRQRRLLLDRYRAAAPKLELAVRNVRVLARAGVRAIEIEPSTGAQLSDAVRHVAFAVPDVAAEIEAGHRERTASRELVDAARRASAVAEGGTSVAGGALVAQVRSTAVDLLQAGGLEHAEAVERVRLSRPR